VIFPFVLNIYEVILTSPISLLKLYYSKLISLFTLTYPTLICAIIVYMLLEGIKSFNIPIEVVLMVLLIIPLYTLLYYAFGLWRV
jgi:ABC-type Na+ efflux pump permease subunit